MSEVVWRPDGDMAGVRALSNGSVIMGVTLADGSNAASLHSRRSPASVFTVRS